MALRTIWVDRKFWGIFLTSDLSQIGELDQDWLTYGPLCGQEIMPVAVELGRDMRKISSIMYWALLPYNRPPRTVLLTCHILCSRLVLPCLRTFCTESYGSILRCYISYRIVTLVLYIRIPSSFVVLSYSTKTKTDNAQTKQVQEKWRSIEPQSRDGRRPCCFTTWATIMQTGTW